MTEGVSGLSEGQRNTCVENFGCAGSNIVLILPLLLNFSLILVENHLILYHRNGIILNIASISRQPSLFYNQPSS